VRVYPYKLVTTSRNFTARMYLHLSQVPHLYIAAPTSIILYGETTTSDDNPLLKKMGLERRAGSSGVVYGGVLFLDGAGGGVEKEDEAGESSMRVGWENDGEEGNVEKGVIGKGGDG
jgi:hypothetical protein